MKNLVLLSLCILIMFASCKEKQPICDKPLVAKWTNQSPLDTSHFVFEGDRVYNFSVQTGYKISVFNGDTTYDFREMLPIVGTQEKNMCDFYDWYNTYQPVINDPLLKYDKIYVIFYVRNYDSKRWYQILDVN